MVWNWAHVHIILNHIPVIAIPMSLLLFAYARVTRTSAVVSAAQVYLVLVALVTFAVYWSGQQASDTVVQMNLADTSAIHAHARVAFYALISSSFLGAWSAFALWRTRRVSGAEFAGVFWVTVTLVAVATSLFAWAANRGGKIQHVEIRQPGYLESIQEDESHSTSGNDSHEHSH